MCTIYNMMKSGIYIMEGYLKWIFDIIRRDASHRSIYRYKICKNCEHNVHGICEQCGCIIKAKVRVNFDIDKDGLSIDGCTEKKW